MKNHTPEGKARLIIIELFIGAWDEDHRDGRSDQSVCRIRDMRSEAKKLAIRCWGGGAKHLYELKSLEGLAEEPSIRAWSRDINRTRRDQALRRN